MQQESLLHHQAFYHLSWKEHKASHSLYSRLCLGCWLSDLLAEDSRGGGTCAFAPSTRLGLSVGLPAFLRATCQRLFRARPPSMHASLLPIVLAPSGCSFSSSLLGLGACHRLPSMRTHLQSRMLVVYHSGYIEDSACAHPQHD